MGTGIIDAIRETAAEMMEKACDAGTALPRVINGIGEGDPEAAFKAAREGARSAASLAGMASGGAAGVAEKVGRQVVGRMAEGAARDWAEERGIQMPELSGGHKCLTESFDAAGARAQLPEEYRKFFPERDGPSTSAPAFGN